MPSNWQDEYETFRPEESESTSKKNEIALATGKWTAEAKIHTLCTHGGNAPFSFNLLIPQDV